jgi:hypothetical protein
LDITERKELNITGMMSKEVSASVRKDPDEDEYEISDYEEAGKPRAFSFAAGAQGGPALGGAKKKKTTKGKKKVMIENHHDRDDIDLGEEKYGNPNLDEENGGDHPFNQHVSNFNIELARRNFDINNDKG